MWTRPQRGLASIPLMVLGVALAATLPARDEPANSAERYSIDGSDVLIIQPAGELRVEPGTGSAVVIEVIRGGRDAGALRFEPSRKHGRDVLTIVYPGQNIIYPPVGKSRITRNTDTDGTSQERWTIRGSGSGTEAWADLRVLVPAGRKVEIRHHAGRSVVAGVDGRLKVDQGWGEVTASDTRGSLTLDTGSGAVKVHDAQGEVTLDTGSGEVTVARVRGNRLSLDTGSGHVSVSGAVVGELDADTGSGSLTLSAIKADRLQLDTGSGQVQVDLASHARSLVLDTGSGGVTIKLPSNFGAEFQIETGSGGIHVDLPFELIRKDRNFLKGKLGDGNGEIRIESGSGGVRIMRRGGGSSSSLIRGRSLLVYAMH